MEPDRRFEGLVTPLWLVTLYYLTRPWLRLRGIEDRLYRRFLKREIDAIYCLAKRFEQVDGIPRQLLLGPKRKCVFLSSKDQELKHQTVMFEKIINLNNPRLFGIFGFRSYYCAYRTCGYCYNTFREMIEELSTPEWIHEAKEDSNSPIENFV